MSLAVVYAVVVFSGYRQRTGRGDGKSAVFVSDNIVALRGFAARLDGVSAYILAFVSVDFVSHGIITDETAYGCGEFRIGFAVYLALVVSFYGNGCGVDSDVAVINYEHNICEVIADILEVLGGKTYIVGICIGALCGSIAGEAEVGFLIQVVLYAHGVAGDGLLGAVIVNGLIAAGDGHDDLVAYGADDELTGLGFYGVVLSDIVALCVLNYYIAAECAFIGACVGALCNVGKFAVGVTVDKSGSSNIADGLLGAVIHGYLVSAGKLDLCLSDGKGTVLNYKHNIFKVFVVVYKLILVKVHVVGICIGALCDSIAGEAEVGFLIQVVVYAHGVAGDGLFGAVVLNGIRIAFDGNGDGVDRINGELTVVCFGYDAGLGSINGADRTFCKLCRILADIGAGRADGEVKACVFIGAGKASYAVLLAVIGEGTAFCGHGHIFIVVEIYHIALDGDGDGSVLIRKCGIAANGDGRLGDYLAESLIGDGLGLSHGRCRSVEVVVDGVGQIASLCPCTDKFYLLVGHCERTVGDLGIRGSPAAEYIARHAGCACYGNGRSLLVVR